MDYLNKYELRLIINFLNDKEEEFDKYSMRHGWDEDDVKNVIENLELEVARAD